MDKNYTFPWLNKFIDEKRDNFLMPAYFWLVEWGDLSVVCLAKEKARKYVIDQANIFGATLHLVVPEDSDEMYFNIFYAHDDTGQVIKIRQIPFED